MIHSVLFEKFLEDGRNGVDRMECAESNAFLLLCSKRHAVECAVKVCDVVRVVFSMRMEAAKGCGRQTAAEADGFKLSSNGRLAFEHDEVPEDGNRMDVKSPEVLSAEQRYNGRQRGSRSDFAG